MKKSSDENLLQAIEFLRYYTRNEKFDPWDLMGPRFSNVRQHVMSVLMYGNTGKKIPKNKCGVTLIQVEMWRRAGTGEKGDCIAERYEKFRDWCLEQLKDRPIRGCCK